LVGKGEFEKGDFPPGVETECCRKASLEIEIKKVRQEEEIGMNEIRLQEKGE